MNLLSSLEGEFIILFSVFFRQLGVVKSLWEEVVNEGTEGEPVRPAVCEVGDVHVLIIPGSTLAPDQDCLHLWAHANLTGLATSSGSMDAKLEGDASVCCHPSSLAVRVEAR